MFDEQHKEYLNFRKSVVRCTLFQQKSSLIGFIFLSKKTKKPSPVFSLIQINRLFNSNLATLYWCEMMEKGILPETSEKRTKKKILYFIPNIKHGRLMSFRFGAVAVYSSNRTRKTLNKVYVHFHFHFHFQIPQFTNTKHAHYIIICYSYLVKWESVLFFLHCFLLLISTRFNFCSTQSKLYFRFTYATKTMDELYFNQLNSVMWSWACFWHQYHKQRNKNKKNFPLNC